MTMSDSEIQAILPEHIDFRRVRSAVAAFVTRDKPGMDLAMAEANSDGRSMNFITALMWELVMAYDLQEAENLAKWRQGILYHAQQIADTDDVSRDYCTCDDDTDDDTDCPLHDADNDGE